MAAMLLTPPGDIPLGPYIESWSPGPMCGQWSRARSRHSALAARMEGWVLGLIAGHNLYNADGHLDLLRASGMSHAEIFEWIDRRCAGQRDRAWVEIGTELIDELRRRAQPSQ